MLGQPAPAILTVTELLKLTDVGLKPQVYRASTSSLPSPDFLAALAVSGQGEASGASTQASTPRQRSASTVSTGSPVATLLSTVSLAERKLLKSLPIPADGVIMHPSNPNLVVTRSGGRVTAVAVDTGQITASLTINEAKQGSLRYFRFVNSELVLLVTSRHLYTWSIVTSGLSEVANLSQTIFKGATSTVVTSCSCLIIPDNSYYAISAFVAEGRSRQETPSTLIVSEAKGNFVLPDTSFNTISMMPTPSGDVTYALAVVKLGEAGGLTVIIKDLLYSLTKGKRGAASLPSSASSSAGSGEKVVTVGGGTVDIPMTLLAVPDLCLLFLSAKSGMLYCIDMFNGVELEAARLSSPMISGAVRQDGSLVALCQDGAVLEVRIGLSALLKTPRLSKEEIFGVASACSFYKDTYPDSFDAVSGLAESVLIGFFEARKYLDASRLICTMGPVLRTPEIISKFPDAQAMNIYCSTLFSTRQKLKAFEAIRLLQCCAAQGPEQLKMFDMYLSRDYIQLDAGDTSLASAVRSLTHNEVLALKAQQLAGSHADTVRYLLQNGGVSSALAYCERVFDEQGTHCFRWLDVIEGGSAGSSFPSLSETDLDRVLASRGCDDETLSTVLLRDVLPGNYKKAMDLISSVMRSDRRRLTSCLQTLFVVCTIRGVGCASIPPEAVKALLLKHLRPESPLHGFDRAAAFRECRAVHMDDLALLLCLEATPFHWEHDWPLVNVDSNWFEDSIGGITIGGGSPESGFPEAPTSGVPIVSQLLTALDSTSSPQARLAVAVVASTLVSSKCLDLPALLSLLTRMDVEAMTPSGSIVSSLCSSPVLADVALEALRRCGLESKRFYEVLLQLYFRLVLYREHTVPAVRVAGIKQLLEFITGAVFSGALTVEEIVVKAGDAFRETLDGSQTGAEVPPSTAEPGAKPGSESGLESGQAPALAAPGFPQTLPRPLSKDDCFAKLCSTVFYLVVTSVLNKKVSSTAELFHFIILQVYLCAGDTEVCGQRFGRGFCEYFGFRDPGAPVRSPLQRTGNSVAMTSVLQTCVLLAGTDGGGQPGAKPAFLRAAAAVIASDAARVYPWEQALGLLQAALQWSTLASLLASAPTDGKEREAPPSDGNVSPGSVYRYLASQARDAQAGREPSAAAKLSQAGVLLSIMEGAAGAAADSRVKASAGQLAAFLSALSGSGEAPPQPPQVRLSEDLHPLQRGLLTSFLQNVLSLLPPSPQRLGVEKAVFESLATQGDIGMFLAMFLRLETNDVQVHSALARLCLERGDDKLWLEVLGHRYGLSEPDPEDTVGAEKAALCGIVDAAVALFPTAEIFNVVCFCRAYLTWRQQEAVRSPPSPSPAWLTGETQKLRDALVAEIYSRSTGSVSPLSSPGINLAQMQLLAVRLDSEVQDYDSMELHVECFSGLDCERLLRDSLLVQNLREAKRLPLLALIHYRCAHYKDTVGLFFADDGEPQQQLSACVSFITAHSHPLLWSELVSRILDAGRIEQALELAAENAVHSLYPGLRQATFSALETLSGPAERVRLISLFGKFIEALIGSPTTAPGLETLPLDRAFCKALGLEVSGEKDEQQYYSIVDELAEASPPFLAELSQKCFDSGLYVSASVVYARLEDYRMLTYCFLERGDLPRALASAILCNDRGAWTGVFKAALSLPANELTSRALRVSALNLLHTAEEASFVSEALRDGRLEDSLLVFQVACTSDGVESLVESNRARVEALRLGPAHAGISARAEDALSRILENINEILVKNQTGESAEHAEGSPGGSPEGNPAGNLTETVQEARPYLQLVFTPCCKTVFTTCALLVATLRPAACADFLKEHHAKIDFHGIEPVIREKNLKKSHSFCLLALGRPDEALDAVIGAYSPDQQDTEANPFSPGRFLKLLAQVREKETCIAALRLAVSIAKSTGSAGTELLDSTIRLTDLYSVDSDVDLSGTEAGPRNASQAGQSVEVHANDTTEGSARREGNALPRPPPEALLSSQEFIALCPGETEKELLFNLYIRKHAEGPVDDLAINTAYVEHMLAEAERPPESVDGTDASGSLLTPQSVVARIEKILCEKEQLDWQTVGDTLAASQKAELRRLGCIAYMHIIKPACAKAERPPTSCLPLIEKTFMLCLQDGLYTQALDLTAATRSRELALNLLDVTAEKDKEIFLDLITSQPQLLRPDRVLGAAYKHGHMTDVMPYLISELGRLYDAVEELSARGPLGSLAGWRHKKRDEK